MTNFGFNFMPKTLFLFQENYMEPKWLELEGDYSHLNQVYINNSPDDVSQVGTLNAYYKKCDELTDLIYHKDSGKHKVTFIDKPTKDWDYFVECGFLP